MDTRQAWTPPTAPELVSAVPDASNQVNTFDAPDGTFFTSLTG